MIKLADVSKYYRSNNNVALGLHKINLEFEMGDFIAITGESGSGKSTLLNVISGSDTYEDGELYFNQEETSYYDDLDWENYRKEKIGFIYQNYNLIDCFSCIENVKTAILIRYPCIEEQDARDLAMGYLEQVGLGSQAEKKATKLSSGQKQRLAIARALAKDTDVIVADEPTGNLDVENSRQIIQILNELSKKKLVLIVTHNYDEVEPYVTRKIRMYDGEVAEDIRLRPNYMQEEKNNLREDGCDLQGEKNNLREDGRSLQGENDLQGKVDLKGEEALHAGDFNNIGEDEKRLKEKAENKVLARRMTKKIRAGRRHSLFVLVLLFIFIFTSIYVFVGSFDKNIDYSTAKKFSNRTFVNGELTRISVRKDGAPLSEKDEEKLQNVRYVQYVDFYDVVNDINFLCEKNKDYAYVYRANEGKETKLPDKISVTVKNREKFLRSASGLKDSQLTGGELPKERYDIVVNSSDKAVIGTTINMYLNHLNNWNRNCMYVEMTVTGITDMGSEGQIFISETLAKMLSTGAKGMRGYTFLGLYGNTGYGMEESEDYPYVEVSEELSEEERAEIYAGQGEEVVTPVMIVNEELTGNEVVLSDNYYSDAFIQDVMPTIYYQMKIRQNALLSYEENYVTKSIDLKVSKLISQHGNGILEISQEMFDRLYPDQNSYQASVYITDYAYMDRAIRAIEKLGYQAVSVYRAGSTEYDNEKVSEQTMLMAISLAALMFVIIVGILLIRIMLGNRRKDFQIMIFLGMNRLTVDHMNLRDIVYNALTAFVSTIILVNIAKAFNIPYIASAVRYYELFDYMLYLMAVSLMMVFLYKSVRLVKKKGRRDV